MTVTVAEHAGFCFGVRRAAETLEQALSEAKDGERIGTLGPLIHNEVYLERMRQRGVLTVAEEEIEALAASADASHPVRILIRAHGIPKETNFQYHPPNHVT